MCSRSTMRICHLTKRIDKIIKETALVGIGETAYVTLSGDFFATCRDSPDRHFSMSDFGFAFYLLTIRHIADMPTTHSLYNGIS